MKKDIILAGVGGQGILSIAAAIGTAALEMGLYLKQSEVHGMSQRGGDVMSNLRISDKEIYSDLIPFGKADIIIAIEPMEGLRYLPMLSPLGWLISNSTPFVNIPNYPEKEKVLDEIIRFPRHVLIDADNIAGNLGSGKAANMVILGAAAPFLEIPYGNLEKAVLSIFIKKDQKVIDLNINALKAGKVFAENNVNI